MAIKKQDEDSVVVVQVRTTFSEADREWISSSRRPALTASGVKTEESLDRLNSLLRQHFQQKSEEKGEDIAYTIEETLDVPDDLKGRVDEYQHFWRQLNELNDKIDNLRKPLAKDLKRSGLMLKQVAKLLGITPTHLGNILRQDGTTGALGSGPKTGLLKRRLKTT